MLTFLFFLQNNKLPGIQTLILSYIKPVIYKSVPLTLICESFPEVSENMIWESDGRKGVMAIMGK